MLSSLAPARRRLVTGVVVAAVLVASALTGLLVRGHSTAAPRPVDQALPGPILVVPGYGGSVTSVRVLAARLRRLDRLDRADREVDVVSLPGDALGDLEEQAAALAAAARHTLQRTGAHSVDVVGYSAGGVVARLWVRDFGGASLARRVVTLGSPHHGSELADLGTLFNGSCPEACRQLTTTSDVLRQLNAGDETPPGPSYVSIWTTADDVVTPPASADLAGALDMTVQSVCATSRVRHSGLPSDPVAIGMVAAQLGAGPTQRLGPADCERLSS